MKLHNNCQGIIVQCELQRKILGFPTVDKFEYFTVYSYSYADRGIFIVILSCPYR